MAKFQLTTPSNVYEMRLTRTRRQAVKMRNGDTMLQETTHSISIPMPRIKSIANTINSVKEIIIKALLPMPAVA